MPSTQDQLNRAISAARLGDPLQALALLRDLTRQDPDCLDAWLWLSELAGTLEEQTAALEKAQALLPPGPNGQIDLQGRLNSLRAARAQMPSPLMSEPARQKPLPAAPPPPVPVKAVKHDPRRDEFLSQAERMAAAGNAAGAVKTLRDLLAVEPQEEQAYLLLAEVQPDPEEKVAALQKLLAVNPQHSEAARRMQALQAVLQNPLQRGIHLEEQGKFDEAIELYHSIKALSPDPAVRVEANRRIDDLRLRRDAYQVQPVHPTLNLLRVMAGPVLLFAVMVFIQSGLNLLHLPLLAFPGLLAVMAGSLLVSAAEMRPAHPRWVELVGTPGVGSEPGKRRSLRLLGWGLMAIPFTLFLIEAGFRLGVLQSSMMEGLY